MHAVPWDGSAPPVGKVRSLGLCQNPDRIQDQFVATPRYHNTNSKATDKVQIERRHITSRLTLVQCTLRLPIMIHYGSLHFSMRLSLWSY